MMTIAIGGIVFCAGRSTPSATLTFATTAAAVGTGRRLAAASADAFMKRGVVLLLLTLLLLLLHRLVRLVIIHCRRTCR